MSDNNPTKIPSTQEETRDFIAAEAEMVVAAVQPVLDALAERWANDPPELARVRKMAQLASVRGLGEWMFQAFKSAGADRETIGAVNRLTASMTDAFERQAAAQAALLAEMDEGRS